MGVSGRPGWPRRAHRRRGALSPLRRSSSATVLRAGQANAVRSRRSCRRIRASSLRGPRVGCRRRASTRRACRTGGVAWGQVGERRERSWRKSRPLALARCRHLYPVTRLMPYNAHQSVKVSNRWRASRMNGRRSIIASTCLQGLGHLHEMP
jgi:hypothetical protein